VTGSIVSLLAHFGWRRFTIVAGSTGRWQSIATQLEMTASKRGLIANGRFMFQEPYALESGDNPLPDIVEMSYVDTRGSSGVDFFCYSLLLTINTAL